MSVSLRVVSVKFTVLGFTFNLLSLKNSSVKQKNRKYCDDRTLVDNVDNGKRGLLHVLLKFS